MTALGLLGPLHAIAAGLGLALLTTAVFRLHRAGSSQPVGRLATISGLLMGLPFALGCAIYPAYRLEIKPGLLIDHAGLARAFESKEHLAAMGLFCVLGGVGALLGPSGRRAGTSLLTIGWLLCASAATIGVVVTWWPTVSGP